MIFGLTAEIVIIDDYFQPNTNMKNIEIKPALNGYICQVGCQQVVYNSIEHLLAELGNYLRDPKGVEKSYIENAVNRIEGVPQTLNETAHDTVQAMQAESSQTTRPRPGPPRSLREAQTSPLPPPRQF